MTLRQDVRYGMRMLVKNPGFTAIAIITMALGIGANTAIFSVVNTILLKSLPYKEADRIVLAWGNIRAEGNSRSQVSATDVADWRKQASVFEDVATFQSYRPIMSGTSGEAERVNGMGVGDGYFKIMKAEPILGRVFTPEENEDGHDQEIILGYGLWQRRFGGDPNIIGKTVLLNSRPHQIVGVMPADFHSLPTTLIEAPADFYRPVGENYSEDERASRHLRAIARLKPGVTIERAQAEMNVIASRLEREHPKENTGYGVRLVTLAEDTIGGLRPTLLTLFGAVVFVLLIACANVGNLLLARSGARQKEIAIRAALGAGRLRLVRQFLTESVLLALVGGVLGLLLALWCTSLIETIGSRVTPLLSGVQADATVLCFTVAISFLSGIVFGLAPAMHVSRPDLNEVLKEGGRSSGAGSSRTRLRSALVVSEVAMALVLLICAALLIKSVMRLRDVNPGFNSENLLTMNITLPSAKYPEKESWVAFYNQVVERVEHLPGVKAAGVTSVLPLSGNFDGRSLAVEDQPKPRGEEISVDLYVTTPGYMRAMEIPVLTGSEKRPQPWRTVVGIVKDVKQYGLDRKDVMQLYLPEAQYPVSYMSLVVRTSSDPNALIAAVKNQVRGVDKDQAVFNVATMEQLLSDSMSLRRFSMLLLLIFALVALLLASVGIYGVISYTVAQRTHEIGLRMALGAQARDVLGMILRQGMALIIAGVSVGLIAAFALTRVMSSLLFEVRASDPATFAGVSVLLTVVALLACYIPARRATRVDPMTALRYE